MIIETKTAKKEKIEIYADGEFMFTVPAVIWYSSRFRDGDDVMQEELSVLKEQGDSFMAYESAMRMLSLRAHSKHEMTVKLSAKFSKDAAKAAVNRLENAGLLDDERFALLLAQELYERKGYAPQRILFELKNRGITGNYAENAVNALDIDKEISIIRVIEKCGINENSTIKEKNRVIRRLINMGYSFSDISKYINIYE